MTFSYSLKSSSPPFAGFVSRVFLIATSGNQEKGNSSYPKTPREPFNLSRAGRNFSSCELNVMPLGRSHILFLLLHLNTDRV
jgi:hypothetical protein